MARTPTKPAAHGFRYAPGLDGVRALAVFAVFAYHIGTTSNSTVLPGGFLGVDIFFVLSGYLITSLLITEVRQHGRISIKKFYIRRARRLLPALFTVLLAVGAIGALWLPQQAARLRGDLLAALGYVTNWWLIAENSSYFATAGDRPPLLTHLWSLAVEEQYYLVWPLVMIAFAAVRAHRVLVLVVILTAVAGSVAVGLHLYDPFADPSRVYYGTDTRALAPLLGAAIAITIQPWQHSERLSRLRRHLLDTLGITALLALTVVAAVLHDTDEVLYRGGFVGIAILAGIVVAVSGHPGTALGEMLGTQPLRWLGERSYAIYLWHWPVCLLTRPGQDIPLTGWANAAVRIGLSIVLAEISYRVVENPIRRHGFLAPFKAPPPGPIRRRPRLAIARTVVLSLIMIAGGTMVTLQLSAASTTTVVGGPVDVGPEATLGPLPSSSPSPGPSPSAAAPDPLAKGAKVAFFGDSQGMTLLINKPADLAQYVTVVDATIEGCGVLVGNVASRSGERRNMTTRCHNWQSRWQTEVTKIKPDLAVVMIGAWDVFDLTLDSGKLTFGTPAWDAHYSQELTRGIDTLRATDTPVALSLLPCYRPLKKSAGFWPERGDDDRTRHVNELLRAAAANYPAGVRTLEPPEEFCTKPAIANNTAYRWDGIHYYRKGAALYFTAILPQLTQPALPRP